MKFLKIRPLKQTYYFVCPIKRTDADAVQTNKMAKMNWHHEPAYTICLYLRSLLSYMYVP